MSVGAKGQQSAQTALKQKRYQLSYIWKKRKTSFYLFFASNAWKRKRYWGAPMEIMISKFRFKLLSIAKIQTDLCARNVRRTCKSTSAWSVKIQYHHWGDFIARKIWKKRFVTTATIFARDYKYSIISFRGGPISVATIYNRMK